LGNISGGVTDTTARASHASRTFSDETVSDAPKIGANSLLASGYTGQTTGTLALATDPFPCERVVGVPLKSYVGLSWTYYFKK
jgi:hypothetical protein